MRAEDVSASTWSGTRPGHMPGGKLGELMKGDDMQPHSTAASTHERGWNPAAAPYGSPPVGQLVVDLDNPVNPLTTVGYNSHIGRLYTEEEAPPHTREEPAHKTDPDYEVMQRYDPRRVGEAYRTYHWKMAAVIVLVGFITTGVATMTVHWRREGCLLYKLTVLEGTTDDCCSHEYDVPDVLNFLTAHRTAFVPVDPPTPAAHKPLCTNISSWVDTDAKTAHIIALLLIILSLVFRMLAMVVFLIGGRKMKLFPVLVLCCGMCEFVCLMAYYLTWRQRFSTGPGLWYVAMQMFADVVAFFSTKTSSRLDRNGKMMAKIAVVEDEVHNMPKRVKIVYGYLLLGYAIFFLPFVVPWKDDVQCGDDSMSRTPAGDLQSSPCCVWYYLMYTRSRCGSATSIFDSKRASITMTIATVTATATLLIALVFQTQAAYLGWKQTTAFPKPGLVSAWLMILCVSLYGGISTSKGTEFTALYVVTCAYEIVNVSLLHLLYWKYHSQLLSDNFNQRRVKAGPDARVRRGPVRLGYNTHEPNRYLVPEDYEDTKTYHNTHRPIVVSKVETRRVKFLGEGFVRGNVQTHVDEGHEANVEDINWEAQGNPLEGAFPQKQGTGGGQP